MVRAIGKLTAPKVKSASKPGLYGDGGGLYLNVGATGGKSWIFRFMLNGRSREMGLGPLNTIGLAEARERALAARRLRLDGIDPLDAKREKRKALAAAVSVTFRHAAEAYMKDNSAAWRNAKHTWQWAQTMQALVYPTIGNLPVASIDTGHVTVVLKPIWTSKTETASRVRGRIETVLDYAKANGWRTGDNPARWRGHLQNLLPARKKITTVAHHAALPWRDMGAFMAELANQDGLPALALQFTVLTAARSGETLGARWSEIDLRNGVWTVPASRMKAQREHKVPLSSAAIEVLQAAATLQQSSDAAVFPGRDPSKGLNSLAMLAVLRRMNRADLTVHGFRSTFSDWAAETTGYQREVVEQALAHTIESKVEAAYRRGDLFEKRRRLMADWAEFCGQRDAFDGNVVGIRLGARQ
jgi:integrase